MSTFHFTNKEIYQIAVYKHCFKLAAARKGIALVNQLTPGSTKERHASRVWRNYNRARAGVL